MAKGCLKTIEDALNAQVAAIKGTAINVIATNINQFIESSKDPITILQYAREIEKILGNLPIIGNSIRDIESQISDAWDQTSFKDIDPEDIALVAILMKAFYEHPDLLRAAIILILLNRLDFYYRKELYYLGELSKEIQKLKVFISANALDRRKLIKIIEATCEAVKNNNFQKIKSLNCIKDQYGSGVVAFVGNLYKIISLYNIAYSFYMGYKFIRYLIKLVMENFQLATSMAKEGILFDLFRRNCSHEIYSYDIVSLYELIRSNCELAKMINKIEFIPVNTNIRYRPIGAPPDFFKLAFGFTETTRAGYEISKEVLIRKNLITVSKFRNSLIKDRNRIAKSISVPGEIAIKDSQIYKLIRSLRNQIGDHLLFYVITGDFEELFDLLKHQHIGFEAIIWVQSFMVVMDIAEKSFGCKNYLAYVRDHVMKSISSQISTFRNIKSPQPGEELDESLKRDIARLGQSALKGATSIIGVIA